MVVTLRNLPREVERAIRRFARERGTSANRVVIGLIEERLGLGAPHLGLREYDDLDGLAGRWSSEEAAAFDRALAAQGVVDPDVWR